MTAPGPILRPARPEDADAIAALWHDSWRDGHVGHVPEALLPHRTPEHFRARVPSRIPHSTVATIDDAVVGFVTIKEDEVEQVYVGRAARGSGVAQALLTHAEQVVARQHATAWLSVAEGNARARRFYEKCGWRDAGAIDYRAEIAGGTLAVPCRRYERQVRQD